MAEEVEETPELADAERRARRRKLTFLLVPIVSFSIAGFVINIAAPALINSHPLVVIFFQPINRYMILAANHVATWEFFAVGFFRLVLLDPIYYLMGRWFGDGALDWVENKTGNTGMIPIIKKWFGKAGPVFVFVAPNAYVCVLAGAAGMNIALFLSLNVAGTIGRLILIKATGNVFEPVLDPILRWVRRYQWPLVAVSLVLFGVQMLANRKSGKGDMEGVGKMADELEASIDAADND